MTFLGIAVSRLKCDDNQKKKFFMNNAVWALIPFTEDQCLLRLHEYLGELSNVGKKYGCLQKRIFLKVDFPNPLESCLSCLKDLLRVLMQKGDLVNILCDAPCMRVIWKLLNTFGWIFGACVMKFYHKTAEIHSLNLTQRWVETRMKWWDSSRSLLITTYRSQVI